MKYTLNGINEIDDILNDFLDNFEATAHFGSDFCCWIDRNEIEYTVIMPVEETMFFMERFNELAPDIHCDPFLASFFHELGHLCTDHLVEDEDALYCRDISTEIGKELSEGKETLTFEERRELNREYFDLPDEKMATEWAIEFMRNNTEVVSKLWEKLHYAIENFYLNNKVEVC